jgi:lysophospholipase L1-like esterase
MRTKAFFFQNLQPIIMLKLASILAFGLFFPLSTVAQSRQYDTIPYAMEYHQKRLDVFKSEPVVKGGTILLGDSHIEFGNWKKHLGDMTLINRGIAGDNTYGVLARLDGVIACSPSRVVVGVGINDIAKNIPDDVVAKNILRVVASIHAALPQTKVLVISIFPTNDAVKKEYPDAFGKNNLAIAVNAKLKNAAKEHHFSFVDVYPALCDTKGNLTTRCAQEDGLHLNTRGYQRWVEILKKFL